MFYPKILLPRQKNKIKCCLLSQTLWLKILKSQNCQFESTEHTLKQMTLRVIYKKKVELQRWSFSHTPYRTVPGKNPQSSIVSLKSHRYSLKIYR